jgi:type II secretory pathway predicted ATPase ExeA
MLTTHFGLRSRPFRTGPDGDAYYPATSHEQAFAKLDAALCADEGLILLTGSAGVGKTLVLHRVLSRHETGRSVVLLTNTHCASRADLLQAILFDLGLTYQGLSEQELRLKLTDHLLTTFRAGQPTLLLIDEAQHLSVGQLEELRLLGNLESSEGKALQVLLCSLPSLRDTVQLPGLASLRQRLAVQAHIAALDVHEAVDYLLHQVRIVGGRPERLFTAEALELCACATQGVPRVLNQVAYAALHLAYAAGVMQVDAELLLEALADLGVSVPDEGPAALGRMNRGAA